MAAGSLVWRFAPVLDFILTGMVSITAPGFQLLAKAGRRLPLARKTLDRLGVSVLNHHYYSPLVFPSDITAPLDAPRQLPALDLNVDAQLALIENFHYTEELLAIPLEQTTVDAYAYHNGSFESGDGEMLYNMIRHFKPRRVVEVGCGQSTLIALLAQDRNRSDDPAYTCQHTCIEPFEQPWLEKTKADVVREKIEQIDSSIISSLESNDIFFIDSSHIIRPQGDVLHEYLTLVPLIKSGVIVHVHDIFTPRNYPHDWIIDRRRLWNEQYLLEAFLSFNHDYEVLAAVNYLSHDHREKLAQACPVLSREIDREPGSFWFRRR